MQTTLIVLTEPFIKHPAGLVFELNKATGVSGWDDDDRVRERMYYGNKGIHFLPDGGNGLSYELPVSAVAPCPTDVFTNENLRNGPCRITRAAYQREGAPNDMWNAGFTLFDIGGLSAQGFKFPLGGFSQTPVQMQLFDALRDTVLRDCPVADSIDGSDLLPGFYQLRLLFQRGEPFYIHFIKSFPLLVFFTDNSGRHTVQKTLY
jgi:hypothetical protein